MADGSTSPDWRLAVDIGGTFTDVVLIDAASGRVVVDKTLTTPAAPLDGGRVFRGEFAIGLDAERQRRGPRRERRDRELVGA